MEYDLPVAQMARGDDIEGFYVLKSAFSKVANNGKPFLNLTLSDRTGAVDAKVWDYPGPIGAADEGKVVKIRGSVSEFRGALQVTVERIRLAGEDDRYDVTALVPTAPIDGEAMYASVEALLDSITDADYKAVCRELLRRHSESFRTIPAAKSVHHGFLHGLLMHTGNMMQLAGFLAGMYADTVDRSLLLAGTFAHDLQKEREFRFSALGLVTDYSVPGQLLGHLVMGAQEAAEVCAARLPGLLRRPDEIPAWVHEGRGERMYAFAQGDFRLAQGRALLLAGDAAAVLGLFHALLQTPLFDKHRLFFIYAHIFLAAAHAMLDAREKALESLRAALDAALPDDVLMPFVENADLVLLLLLAPQETRHEDGVRRILALAEPWLRHLGLPGTRASEIPFGLSVKQYEIARLAAEGRTGPEIACRVGLGLNTVKTHLKTVYRKCGANNRPELRRLLHGEK